MNLEHFCITVDKSLPDSVCDALVESFKANSTLHNRVEQNYKPQFTQLVFPRQKHWDPALHDICGKATLNAIELYKSKVPETSYWPKEYGFEMFRIKHYSCDKEDRFDSHIDVNNLENNVRFLAFFWYLNDVEEGGETEFNNFDLKIKPKKGTLFMFPPLWLYPHAGRIPISNDKYILSSYLHFIK